MILPLRQRHRRMFAVIGVLLPIAFAVGIAARKPVPGMASLPGVLAVPAQRFEITEWERADLFVKTPVKVRLLRERSAAWRFAVGLSAPSDFVEPDLLVYWAEGSVKDRDTLPVNARLLGAFNGATPLRLPTPAATATGVLVLYSLADQEVVEASKPFNTQPEGRVTRGPGPSGHNGDVQNFSLGTN